MIKHFTHYNGGRVCSRAVSFDYDGEKVFNVSFDGGCPGNTTGVAALANGRTPEELINLLSGIKCRGEESCPNELAVALQEFLEEERLLAE